MKIRTGVSEVGEVPFSGHARFCAPPQQRCSPCIADHQRRCREPVPSRTFTSESMRHGREVLFNAHPLRPKEAGSPISATGRRLQYRQEPQPRSSRKTRSSWEIVAENRPTLLFRDLLTEALKCKDQEAITRRPQFASLARGRAAACSAKAPSDTMPIGAVPYQCCRSRHEGIATAARVASCGSHGDRPRRVATTLASDRMPRSSGTL